MKKITNKVLLFTALIALTQCTFAQETKFQLSSHILDITTGKPAKEVEITLSKLDKNDNWILLEEKNTDSNGRVNDFLKQDGKDNSGIYKLTFHTSPYFKSLGQKSFYPFIEVVFELVDNEHYHVPITLSPFGYSTYRGN
ncbi:MAG TPA: hydroxyisourate hydrolase [Flavobacterium sp.]|nr:hydroxyisourate hydrolase [Flavobacterium sp.]